MEFVGDVYICGSVLHDDDFINLIVFSTLEKAEEYMAGCVRSYLMSETKTRRKSAAKDKIIAEINDKLSSEIKNRAMKVLSMIGKTKMDDILLAFKDFFLYKNGESPILFEIKKIEVYK